MLNIAPVKTYNVTAHFIIEVESPVNAQFTVALWGCDDLVKAVDYYGAQPFGSCRLIDNFNHIVLMFDHR